MKGKLATDICIMHHIIRFLDDEDRGLEDHMLKLKKSEILPSQHHHIIINADYFVTHSTPTQLLLSSSFATAPHYHHHHGHARKAVSPFSRNYAHIDTDTQLYHRHHPHIIKYLRVFISFLFLTRKSTGDNAICMCLGVDGCCCYITFLQLVTTVISRVTTTTAESIFSQANLYSP